MPIGITHRLFGGSYLSDYDLGWPDASAQVPIYVRRETALLIARSFGCRLPYEVEWEYGCRAKAQTLFVWGNELPADEELEGWLDFGLPREQWKSNGFGLSLLFCGEWCMDEWTGSHAGGESPTAGVYVIKGGGSVFWPWQDAEEWIWCVPANRMPSTNLFEDGMSAFRLVRELPPEIFEGVVT
jgi:hypothetical protein